MKALARYGKEFGGYRLIDVPVPQIGEEDLLVKVGAATICGADMKHFRVDNGSQEFNSIRGHEFAGEIVKVGSRVTDWHVGQRVVSDNTGHVCGTCPACEQADFLCCENKVNIGLDNNRWGGGFTKYTIIPGEILRIHRHAIWELPDWLPYEQAAAIEPLCNSYKAVAEQTHLRPGQDVVIIGAGPLGLYSVQVAKLMGAVNIVLVGLDADVSTRFKVAKQLGATHLVNGSQEDVVARCQEICGKDNLGLVIECSGANIALEQAITMVRPNAEIVRAGMGFKPLNFPINRITEWNISLIGHMAYDSTTWRNVLRLVDHRLVQLEPMITHRFGLSEWEKGFEAMAAKDAIKVVLTYDFED
ncbi:zinc-binding dehydrogenase [Actinomyces qiguomingii]|uniref:zinc-binding dehydrogenase n=1 Tax=Actinomyces qiguomingii TaxID=2057800 RepID=UPI000CA05F1D|nr:zinc-binding dehydrogenase [Actinomyces qiguomingii]